MSSGDISRKELHGHQPYSSPGKSTKSGASTSQSPRRPPGTQHASGSSSTGSGGGAFSRSAGTTAAGSRRAAAAAMVVKTAAPRTGAPYSHRSVPSGVRSRSIGSLTWQGQQDAGAGSGDEEYCDGFGSDAEQGISRAAAERMRLRRILDGVSDDSSAATAIAPAADLPVGPPLTEQDATCEVAAAGIIVACQDSGMCDVSMRGVTRLPPSLYKFFRAEGGLVLELQVQGNRLSVAPPLELLPALTRLDLSANLLSSVPDSLGKLTRLRALDLSRNTQLLSLPDCLCDLTMLTSLDLSHNALKCLPLRMGQLNRLVEMRLDSNQLSYLPAEVAGLPSLTALHASYNRITALPSEIGSASSLTGIFLNHNKLTALPATIGQLRQRLADLHLHNNELTVFPREVGLLASLTRITTSCNPVVHPPLTVACRGVAAVREYLLADWRGPEEGVQEQERVGDGNAAGGGGESTSLEQQQPGQGHALGEGGGGGAGEGGRGASSPLRGRRLVLGGACKSCAEKDDRIEELGQLLQETRERLERCERQLDHSQEKLRRQAQDLTVQAQRNVQLDAEILRLNRQLATAALTPGRRPAGGGGSGGSGSERRTEEAVEHLQRELKEARGTAAAAVLAAEAAEREARRLRRDLERRGQEVAAYRERSEELSASLGRERERCIAAVEAATDATQKLEQLQAAVKERDELRKKLEISDKANKEAWQAAQVAREGHLSSEATADLMQGKLLAAEAIHRRLAQQLQEEKVAGVRATAEAHSRQLQLKLELDRLRSDLAALMAEREVLHGLTPHQTPPGTGTNQASRDLTQPLSTLSDGPGRSAWAAPQRI